MSKHQEKMKIGFYLRNENRIQSYSTPKSFSENHQREEHQ